MKEKNNLEQAIEMSVKKWQDEIEKIHEENISSGVYESEEYINSMIRIEKLLNEKFNLNLNRYTNNK